MANRNNTRETTVRQVSDLPDMQRIGPAIREDRDLVFVETSHELFYFDAQSTAAPDGVHVLAPESGTGRFHCVGHDVTTAITDASFPGTDEGMLYRTAPGTYAVKRHHANPADPVVTDDSSQGYGVWSIWRNTLTQHLYLCEDATVGAAVWKRIAYDTEVAKVDSFDAEPSYARVDGSHAFTAPVPGVAPVAAADLATKAYVDAKLISGVALHEAVRFVVEDNIMLPAHTYNNGALGVGATLTADANGVIPAFDGVTPIAGDRCLVEHDTNDAHSGIYVVTDVGADDPGGSPWVLTRAPDADESLEMESGALVLITEGTTHQGVLEMMNPYPGIVIGVDPQVFEDVSAPNVLTASLGVERVGSDFRARLDGTSLARSVAGIKVDVLETDAQHGVRGGNLLHSVVVPGGAAGFMDGTRATKLDAIEALADVTDRDNVFAAGGVQWRKKTVDHTTLVGLSAAEDVTLLAASAGDMIHDAFMTLEVVFSGGGALSCTASIGITGAPTGFVLAQNVFTGAALGRKGNTSAQKGVLALAVPAAASPLQSHYQVAAGGTTLLARFTVDGGHTTGALSAGSATIYYLSARPVAA